MTMQRLLCNSDKKIDVGVVEEEKVVMAMQ
jgi:hypothetical protein